MIKIIKSPAFQKVAFTAVGALIGAIVVFQVKKYTKGLVDND